MTIEVRREIKDEQTVIPKGTRGQVAAVQWGDKKDGYVVDFPQSSGVYVAREDVNVLTVEKVVEKPKTTKTHSDYEENKKKVKGNEQTREEEL